MGDIDVCSRVESRRGGLELHPSLEALKCGIKAIDHTEERAREVIARMNHISALYNNVVALSTEFNLRTNFDKDAITFIDFTGTEFQVFIDSLHDEGILEGKRIYKFENKEEIEKFKARLEGVTTILRNKGQEPPLRLQAILSVLELFEKTLKTIADQDEKLKEKTNRS